MSGGRWRRGPGIALHALVVGGTIAGVGAGMLVCSAVGALGDGRAVSAVAIPGAAALALGALTVARTDVRSLSIATIRPLSGFSAVAAAWVAAALVGAIPYLDAGTFSSPIDAVFEAMSGVTTTGATLITDIEAQPDGLLLWRSMSQWLGGIGIVVLVVAIAPVSGAGLQRAFYAEVSGISEERLTPRIIDTAKIIAGIYLVLSVAAIVAYLAAGLNLYDAVAHMFTTVATGGFSTRNASIAAFDSVGVEAVAIAFMTFGAINFAFYWRAIRGGASTAQWAEVRVFFAILLGTVAAITVSLMLAADGSSVWTELRGALFSATSVMTTTGYTTVDFDLWNDTARSLMLLLMIVGGCAGSTAGGMKVIRVVLLGKAARQEVRHQSEPSTVQVLRLGGHPFPERVRTAVLGFALVYVAVLVTATIALIASGLSFDSGLSAAISGINIIGPGLGDVGATDNFEALSPGGRIMFIVLMLTGRLEVFTVVALLTAVRLALTRR